MVPANEALSISILAIMYFGDVVFAISGALTAARYRMDILGFVLIGTITGIGGQGIQLAGQILARAAIAEEREVMMLGTYGGTIANPATAMAKLIATLHDDETSTHSPFGTTCFSFSRRIPSTNDTITAVRRTGERSARCDG